MEHTIDATNESLGRLASKIAVILRGKLNPTYQPNELPKEKVIIKNVSKIRFTGKKADQKVYYHYSGYPGGMKAKTLKNAAAKNPQRVLRMAVYRMLAQNRTRDKIIKNLTFEK